MLTAEVSEDGVTHLILQPKHLDPGANLGLASFFPQWHSTKKQTIQRLEASHLFVEDFKGNGSQPELSS